MFLRDRIVAGFKINKLYNNIYTINSFLKVVSKN